MEPPKVFASYSHDSDEHKQWVLKLCNKLVENGVDVMLDQWDVRLGTDQTFFMEKLSTADRVLMICTDAYVKKADNREGGVGYEGLIITEQIAEDVKTDKFIPVIRQSSNERKMPIFLGKRQYIEFTDDDRFDEKFNELLHDIHGVPIISRPPLGENPLTKQSSEFETSDHNLPEIPDKIESVSDAYESAFEFARADDTLGWQELVGKIRSNVQNSLEQLKQENLNSGNLENAEQRIGVVDKAINIISPLISVALAGVKSQNQHFNNQTFIFESLRSIDGWNRNSGDEYRIGIPNFLGYVYQSLHGSISLNTNQLSLALDLARFKVPIVRSPQSQHDMVWKITMLMGWSQALNQKCTENWQYLADAYERWKWLRDVFEDNSTYLTSLVAYYMALKIHEWAVKIASKSKESLNAQYLNVPLDFLFEESEIIERATSLLLRTLKVSELWECVGVNIDQMRDSWEMSIEQYSSQLLHFYDSSHLEFLSKIPRQYLTFFDVL